MPARIDVRLDSQGKREQRERGTEILAAKCKASVNNPSRDRHYRVTSRYLFEPMSSSILENQTPTESAKGKMDRPPIFSAYEVGRKVLTLQRLQELSGYEYILPGEDDPAVQVYDLYRNYPDLQYLPVQNSEGRITGYTLRNQFLAILSKNHYSRELMLRPDVKTSSLMRPEPVILDAHSTLSEASQALMARPEESRFDPFVVTLDDEFYGISTVDLVLRGMNSFLRRDNEACLEAQHALLEWNEGPEFLAASGVRESSRSGIAPSRAVEYSRYVRPLSGPGGDFVQSYSLGPDHTLFLLFDVCGKGLKASSMVSILGSCMHTMLSEGGTVSRDARFVGRILQQLNRTAYDLSPAEMYATGIAMVINAKEQRLTVYDFGHGMLWVTRGYKTHRLEKTRIGGPDQAPFLGMHGDLQIEPVHYRLQDRDLLFSCSDGILEQRDGSGQMFGASRIEQILTGTRPDPARINREVLQYWESFREDTRPTDDLSMLSVQFNG